MVKQRFGKLVKLWPGLGELRKQKKEPHVEVVYLMSDVPGSPTPQVYYSLNHCTDLQLEAGIRRVGNALQAKAISQEDAEILLDKCYEEVHKRTTCQP